MTMARLEVRVKSLEETQHSLRELPARLGVLEKRFDALEHRLEVVEQRLAVVEVQIVELRAEMQSGFSAIRDALAETNRHMRVLHEEILGRIRTISHG